MARDWQDVAGTNASPWGIPPTVLQNFDTLIAAADTTLSAAKNETTRTPVVTAQCKEAFDALTTAMRDMKRRYFLTPPLADSDYISLGLKPHDSTPTASGTPTAHNYPLNIIGWSFASQNSQAIRRSRIARHELGVKIIYVTGSPADSANKGFRIWYSVIAPGETPPASPDDLRRSFFTKRKKDVIEFEFGDSGRQCFMAVQIENEGKKGPWGPLTQALIP